MSSADAGAPRHDPTYLSGGRAHWAFCSCGWQSQHFSGQPGVQREFGEHLVARANDLRALLSDPASEEETS